MEVMDELLNINEAAELINVNPETLRRWDKEEKLVSIRVNDRGDRRYRKSDVLKFIKYNKAVVYKDYSINWDSDGFLSMPANFGLIGRIIAHNKERWVGFAFAISGFNSFERIGIKDTPDEKAIEKIKEYIDKNKIFDGDTFTFEFRNGSYDELQSPDWWNGKYSKSLVEGLRIEATVTHPTTARVLAWRVILSFKSKQADYWVSNTFGLNHQFHEYFVWIDAKELIANGLPNTAKGAEVLAVDFGIKRFEETKDENGNRDITRINENNAAFYEGKWVKDSLLPDKLTS